MQTYSASFLRFLAAFGLLFAAMAAGQEPASPSRAGTGGLFDEIPVVEGATMHMQTLQEAPANVTVITQEDIRKYGYHTLGQALASARGFYMTGDRAYHYVGLRGFLLPGDYNTRFLVMINGHALTEIVFNSNNFFGQDFGLDMDLVKRIEIIRGPGSSLYGSNGVLCTVNVIAMAPVEHERASASGETGSFGERKLHAAGSFDLGGGANMLVSMSGFHNGGQDLHYPEFDTPENGNGWARGVDGERGYHGFANVVWRNWSFVTTLSARKKQVPVVPWFLTKFADRGTSLEDDRSYAEVRYSHALGSKNRIEVRGYYDRYVSDSRYVYEWEKRVEAERDYAVGDWVGTQVLFRRQSERFGGTTIGGEVIGELRNLQTADTISPIQQRILWIEKPDIRGNLLAQQEFDISRRWKSVVSLRYDRSGLFGDDVSPRVALMFQESPSTVYKFVWGRSFRNPSVYEAFYDDGGLSQRANFDLRPEHATTWETSWEHRLKRRFQLVLSAYRYDLSGLIQAVEEGGGGAFQYRNLSRNRAYGAEFEVYGQSDRVEGGFSAGIQRARETDSGAVLPNSPGRSVKARLAVPLLRKKVYVSTAWEYLGVRETLASYRLPGVLLGDLTVSTFRLHPNFDVEFGVRNLMDRAYDDAAGGAMVVDRIRADGRSVHLKLMWHTRE